jgi:hypothetical protein
MVYPNGPNHLPLVGTIHDTGKGLLLPKRQHGPRLFGIECDRKQEKYKLLKPSKGERRNGAENTPNGRSRTLYQKKDETFWTTQTDDETKHPS